MSLFSEELLVVVIVNGREHSLEFASEFELHLCLFDDLLLRLLVDTALDHAGGCRGGKTVGGVHELARIPPTHAACRRGLALVRSQTRTCRCTLTTRGHVVVHAVHALSFGDDDLVLPYLSLFKGSDAGNREQVSDKLALDPLI